VGALMPADGKWSSGITNEQRALCVRQVHAGRATTSWSASLLEKQPGSVEPRLVKATLRLQT
jgi:hypothetical protein